MEPTFTPTADRTGIQIADPIENARFALYTPTAVEPRPAASDEFYFPVDSAVAVETESIVVPKLLNLYVRTQRGDYVADNADHEDRSLAPDAYTIELSTAPVKLYLSVESGLELHHEGRAVTVEFDGPTEVRLGARSFHDRPAGTITTTDDPVGAMRALSYLGSALKTTSPERSFPTLRGHPPLVEVGDEFHVPEGIEKPDTGVRLELPADYEYVYPAASLAYYLGAEVVPADDPRLVTDEGFTYELDGPEGYEQTVGRVLRQTFLLDCVTRTEGYYQVDLHERDCLDASPDVDLDFADLYDCTLAERLEAYLSMPFEVVEEYGLDWNLTTDVMATPANAEVLPFVANDLALIRCPGDPATASVDPTPDPVDEFFRSTTDATSTASSQSEIFNPKPAETIAHSWVGDGFPLDANKATIDSYRRRIDRSAPEKTQIEIHVVCNDDQMSEEGIVEEFYGVRDLLRFDVTVHYELTTDELRELLAQPADFLHYVGHVDDKGMRCRDGHLDARTLSDVNVKAFVLNACRSYAQGEALVESGSYGGVVTLAEVANTVATEIGQTLARLLNCGFPLRAALSIVKGTIGSAYQYSTIGDGGLTLCQSESGVPIHVGVESMESGDYQMEFWTYPSPSHGLGSIERPNVKGVSTWYLASGLVDTYELTADELDSFLDLEVLPVKIDGELRWSDEIRRDEL